MFSAKPTKSKIEFTIQIKINLYHKIEAKKKKLNQVQEDELIYLVKSKMIINEMA